MRLVEHPLTGFFALSILATASCMTPWQTRSVGTQLSEIRQQIDGLENAQETHGDAIRLVATRFQESRPPPSSSSGAVRKMTQSPGNEEAADPEIASSSTVESEAVESEEEAEKTVQREGSAVLYRRGYTLYHQGDYAGAERTLQSFLAAYPAGPEADNAQYWIGECYYSRGLYTDAIEQFTVVTLEFPDGNKAAHALYKIALSNEKLGDREAMNRAFETLIRDYPDSDVSALGRRRISGP